MNVVDIAGTWLKRALILKASKVLLTRSAGIVALKVGAVAGAGYLAYTLLKRKGDNSTTRIDDIDDNYPDVEGDNTIVV